MSIRAPAFFVSSCFAATIALAQYPAVVPSMVGLRHGSSFDEVMRRFPEARCRALQPLGSSGPAKPAICTADASLFGHSAEVRVGFNQYGVNGVTVHLVGTLQPVRTARRLVTEFTKELGPPVTDDLDSPAEMVSAKGVAVRWRFVPVLSVTIRVCDPAIYADSFTCIDKRVIIDNFFAPNAVPERK